MYHLASGGFLLPVFLHFLQITSAGWGYSPRNQITFVRCNINILNSMCSHLMISVQEFAICQVVGENLWKSLFFFHIKSNVFIVLAILLELCSLGQFFPSLYIKTLVPRNLIWSRKGMSQQIKKQENFPVRFFHPGHWEVSNPYNAQFRSTQTMFTSI